MGFEREIAGHRQYAMWIKKNGHRDPTREGEGRSIQKGNEGVRANHKAVR